MTGAADFLDARLYGDEPAFTARPSRVLPDYWCVYSADGQVQRKRTRIALFATREEAEAFAAVCSRRRKSDQSRRHGAQGDPGDGNRFAAHETAAALVNPRKS